jgi:hypothetical protein
MSQSRALPMTHDFTGDCVPEFNRMPHDSQKFACDKFSEWQLLQLTVAMRVAFAYAFSNRVKHIA